MDSTDGYADLAVFRKGLGGMIDQFLVVHGAYSTQGERDWNASAPADSRMYEDARVSRRKFRKLVRRGVKLLRARGWAWTIDPNRAILAAARAWEREERGPMRGNRPVRGVSIPVLASLPKSP